ncbi:hypothetical protein CI610_02484 [invertebrate metagenome]|uniref:Blue (type 1) copper domain-containing protein n=1 Tax=invertebrate metagenome TaxID=1711999 RepID=A0A2H9T5U7_9ZZZZ
MRSNCLKWMTVLVGTVAFTVSSALYAAGSQGHHNHDLKDHPMPHHSRASAGTPGKAEHVDRTLSITMHDNMRYNLEELHVTSGETIRFIIINQGKIPHEFTIGNHQSLLAHRDMMRQIPDMHHEEENAITLNAGESGELIWTFGSSTNMQAACLLPGHYEAGMKMEIRLH